MRVGAHGILTDDSGRTLLRQSTSQTGGWWVPGGRVPHAENPADTVVRRFAAETGLVVETTGLRSVTSAVVPVTGEWSEHNTLILYEVKAVGGTLRDDSGDDDTHRWCDIKDLAGQPMCHTTSTMLRLPATGLPTPPTGRAPAEPPGKLLEQRVGAYAWLTRPDGRVLLTMIPEGYWAAGRWHLPGGGVDFGETPEQGLAREVYEETSQQVRLRGLRGVASRHDPDSVAPDGRPSDFHGINIVWDAEVTHEVPLEILDVGGSTSDLRWFDVAEIEALPKTAAVEAGLALR